MSDWKIKGSTVTNSEMARFAVTGGLSTILGPPEKHYSVENKESGETRRVTAHSAGEVGRKIARGEFAD